MPDKTQVEQMRHDIASAIIDLQEQIRSLAGALEALGGTPALAGDWPQLASGDPATISSRCRVLLKARSARPSDLVEELRCRYGMLVPKEDIADALDSDPVFRRSVNGWYSLERPSRSSKSKRLSHPVLAAQGG